MKNKHPKEEAETWQEKADWTDAARCADELLNSAKDFKKYMNGGNGSPVSANDALIWANRAASAIDRAIAVRIYRAEMAKKKK